MDFDINQPIVGITLFVAMIFLIIMARSAQLLYGPRSKPAPLPADQVRELEVRLKLAHGSAMLEDLMNLTRIYRQANHFDDAERYCKQALQIAEAEHGSDNEALVPILNEYAKVLTGMRRKVEADKIKERAKKIGATSATK